MSDTAANVDQNIDKLMEGRLMPPHADACFNMNTENTWVELPDGTSVHLGSALSVDRANYLVADCGLIRLGDWAPAYGSVVTCPVVVPNAWNPPPAPVGGSRENSRHTTV